MAMLCKPIKLLALKKYDIISKNYKPRYHGCNYIRNAETCP